jgi:hypothetical protein
MVRPSTRTTPTVREGSTNTPDPQQLDSQMAPYPGSYKRPLDDELHQIEVEKARLELDRQRKAAAFEEEQRARQEEQRAKQIAFEDERRAKELAFDEERRAQERELHQQKLAQLTSADSSGTRRADQDDDEGEIPSEAKAVSLLFPIAPQKEIAAIFEGKFDPVNLYKLRGRVSLTKDDDDEISVTGGKLRAKKRSGTAKDYPRPDVWSEAFLQYIAILSRFDKYNGLTYPLILFHGHIMDLSKSYSWEAVLILALTFHTERTIVGLNDQEAWKMPPGVIDRYLRDRVKPTNKSPTPSRPPSTNSPTTYCMKWNAGDCNWEGCNRKHACRRCGKDYKEKDHKEKDHRKENSRS